MTELPPIPRRVFWGIILIGIGLILFAISYNPNPNLGGIEHAWGSAAMQQSHAIDLAMFSYANDNNQKYPDGKSSTEVFQKLMDGGYITDASIFYLPLTGKAKWTGHKLKPENVGFDVTSGLEGTSPNQLPVVYMTGFKVSYTPGGAAVPIPRTYSLFGNIPAPLDSGIAVTYKSNSAMFKDLSQAPNGSASIPNFVSPDFKPDGKTYRQLTPQGQIP
jgi:hypothetical protein